MNLRDTLIHVHWETQQECISIGNSKKFETLIPIKEDKYINYRIIPFADEGELCLSENVLSWINLTYITLSKKYVKKEECIQSDTILRN